MKKLILTSALAFALALPVANTASAAEVNVTPSQSTQTVFTTGRWGSKVPVFYSRRMYNLASSSMDREGHHRKQRLAVHCSLPVGTEVIFTPYRDSGVGEVQVVGSGCKGWIDRAVIRFANTASAAEVNVTTPKSTQTVFTTGRWGSKVPVFYSRRMYYSARFSMEREGHHRRQRLAVHCSLPVGTEVKFTPYRDWGVGEVQVVGSGCKGWIDRAVIR